MERDYTGLGAARAAREIEEALAIGSQELGPEHAPGTAL